MGLFSMLRTSASGMAAQANRLSTVADNIANAGTTEEDVRRSLKALERAAA